VVVYVVASVVVVPSSKRTCGDGVCCRISGGGMYTRLSTGAESVDKQVVNNRCLPSLPNLSQWRAVPQAGGEHMSRPSGKPK